MKFSQINGGIPVQFDPATDVMVGVRTIDGVSEDRLFIPPPLTAYGNDIDITAGAAAGVSADVSAGKTCAGLLVLTTGASAGTGTLATATYPEAFPNGSFVCFMPANAAAIGAMAKFYAVGTAAGFTLTATSALTDATEYRFNYIVIGE